MTNFSGMPLNSCRDFPFSGPITDVIPRFFLGFCLIISCHLQAQRGYEYDNFGNRSVLLNGNVTGSVSDLGAVYYNPARLALIENPGFLIQGKFYEWTDIKASGIIPNEDISVYDFDALPGMVAGTLYLFGVPFYYSNISRNRVKFSLNYTSEIVDQEDFPGLEPGNIFNLQLSLNNNLKDEWYGLTWATKVTGNFALGVSVFASFYRYNGGDVTRFIRSQPGMGVEVYETNFRFSQYTFGLYFKLAAAWIFPKWELGINVDFPHMELYSRGSLYFDEFISLNNNEFDFLVLENFRDLESRNPVPWSVNIGAGIPIHFIKLHLNLSWYSPLDNYERLEIPELTGDANEKVDLVFREGAKSVINYGFGAEIEITKRFKLYLSYSTDFSPLKEAKEVVESENGIGISNLLAFDNYHYGGGFNIRFKNWDMVLGGVYSARSKDFTTVRQRNVELDLPQDDNFTLTVERFRLLIGLNINFRKMFDNKLLLDEDPK